MLRKEALKRVLFLRTVPEECIDALAAAGYERRLCKGEMLFAEQERCLGLVVVLTGAVKVYKLDQRGRELTLDREIPGRSVAEVSLFDGGVYLASAEAAEEGTSVLIVPPDRFTALMHRYPQIGEQGLRMLAIRMRRLVQMLEAQTLHTVRARLATYLLAHSEGRISFRLAETNEAIGNQIGTVREVVSRTLHSFKAAGAISVEGRSVSIRNLPLLQKIAANDSD